MVNLPRWLLGKGERCRRLLYLGQKDTLMTNLPKSVPNPLLPAGWLTWKQITLVREEVAVEVGDNVMEFMELMGYRCIFLPFTAQLTLQHLAAWISSMSAKGGASQSRCMESLS